MRGFRQPPVAAPEPTAQDLRALRGLVLLLGAGGNLASDARVAARAMEHGRGVALRGNDFRRIRQAPMAKSVRYTEFEVS